MKELNELHYTQSVRRTDSLCSGKPSPSSFNLVVGYGYLKEIIEVRSFILILNLTRDYKESP